MATVVASKETGDLLQELKSENKRLAWKIERLEDELALAKQTIQQLDAECDSLQEHIERY